jgi:hypothetical protein
MKFPDTGKRFMIRQTLHDPRSFALVFPDRGNAPDSSTSRLVTPEGVQFG